MLYATEVPVTPTSVSIEILTRKVEMMITWVSIADLTSLINEVINATRLVGLNEEYYLTIITLGDRVEKRIISLAQEETNYYVKGFEDDDTSPRHLKYERDDFRAMADNAPTARLQKIFRACSHRIQEALNRGSERLAEYNIQQIEDGLSHAEEIIGDEFISENLFAIESSIHSAERRLRSIKKVPHLWHQGFPVAAKKRGLSSADFYANLMRRIIDGWQTFAPLYCEEKSKTKEQKALELQQKLARLDNENREQKKRREEISAQLEQKWKKAEIEDSVAAIERRSVPAGRAARQFLEFVEHKNSAAAQGCLYRICREDGGVPPLLQEMYGQLLRSTQVRI